MSAPASTFPAFVSLQVEELRNRLVAEFERLHADGNSVQAQASHAEDDAFRFVDPPDGVLWAEPEIPEEEEEGDDAEGGSDGCSEGSVSIDCRHFQVHSSLKILNNATRREQQRPSALSPSLAEENRRYSESSQRVRLLHQFTSESNGPWDLKMSEDSRISASALKVNAISEKPFGLVGENFAPPSPTAQAHHLDWGSPWKRYFSDPGGNRGFSPKSIFAPNGVILPTAVLYRSWSDLISVLVFINCFLTPFRFGFEEYGTLNIVDQVLDSIFCIDILLTFNVAVTSMGGLVTSRKQIFREYALSSRFFIDVAATVPFGTIWGTLADQSRRKNKEIVSALGLLRLLRVNRLLILFRELQKNTYFNLVGVVVAKFVLFILLCTHTSGCIFYKLAHYGDFGEGTWVSKVTQELREQPLATRYMHALFWAVGTFKAGPASGELVPSSNSEMLLACFMMMVNICVQTYLVSNMAALLTTSDLRIYNMRNQLMQISDFAIRHQLPAILHAQLRSFVKFKLSSNDDADQHILAGLPDLFRQQVSHVLFEDIVRRVDIFHSCADLFLRQLHSSFKATLYMPDQQLAAIDGPSSSLQVVAEGQVELRHRGAGVIGICSPGECFTAFSFLCKVGQPYSVHTRMICRVLSLGDSAWETACTAFPENLQRVKHNLLLHCENKVSEHLPTTAGFIIYSELVELVKSHLVQQEELTVAMICSSAARGDIADLKRRLVANTPNCANYDCRTPLHLAASHGQLEVCRVLLEAQALVDPVDSFGFTPLLESCRARHESVTQLLFTKKATLGTELKAKISRTGTENEALQTSEAGELCQAAADVEQLWYLRALLRSGANPNVGDYDARTALHVANATGNKPAVELLISHPTINVDPRDNFGRTPLMEAVRHGHESCARLMKARGAFHGFITEPKAYSDSNSIPVGQELCQAAFSNQMGYLHNLITFCGINVDSSDYDLRTALMLASAEGNMSVAVSLVKYRADMHRKDRWGHTALTEAEEHGHADLANVLKLMDSKKQ